MLHQDFLLGQNSLIAGSNFLTGAEFCWWECCILAEFFSRRDVFVSRRLVLVL